MTTEAVDVEKLGEKFEGAAPEESLKWALEAYDNIALASSFGAEDVALIHIATKIKPDVKIVYLDTGFQFKESDELKNKFKNELGANVVEYSGDQPIGEFKKQHGEDVYDTDPTLCCTERKTKPLRRALGELDAWITGMRREQSPTRANMKVVELDGDGRVKINPLAAWKKEELWKFIHDNKIPYNPLHDQGYPSIGCAACTKQIKEGEDERSGRWAGKNKVECGIHTFNEDDDK